MENASKALIIAGAILISILIISFGVIILGQGSQVINNADMSSAEISTFNAKWEAYEGSSVRGSNVNQMIKAVKTHNIQQSDDNKKIVVMHYDKGTTVPSSSNAAAASIVTGGLSIVVKAGTDGAWITGSTKGTIGAGSTYTVKCITNTDTSLVYVIAVIEK